MKKSIVLTLPPLELVFPDEGVLKTSNFKILSLPFQNACNKTFFE